MYSYLDIAFAVLIGSILSRRSSAACHSSAPWLRRGHRHLLLAVGRSGAAAPLGWLAGQGCAAVLVREGRIDERAMRKVGISWAELEEATRQAYVTDLSQVKTAILERSGHISLLPGEIGRNGGSPDGF